MLMKEHDKISIEGEFHKRLSRDWLKTHDAGYRPPVKCLLFGSKWNSFLEPTDGPFIDENHYGAKMATYQKELNAIGVTIDVEKGCFLLADYLDSLSESDTIVKIYKYLFEHSWKPEEKAAKSIWIPDGTKGGKWVDSEECVIHDPDKLFGSKFYVLEDLYDKKVLPFFSSAMEVKSRPSVDDYCYLWNEWESSVEKLSYDKCYKFWMFILKHLSTNKEKKLADSLMKLPATSGNDDIFLLDKENVFIPDSLHLKKLFEHEKIFVFCPQQNLVPLSRCKLFDIFRKVSARNISESVCKEESSLLNGVNGVQHMKQVDPDFNLKGLVKLILGFLACSSLKMEPEKRHKAVQCLLNLSFFEIMEPVSVKYTLSLSSRECITKEANKVVRWERPSSQFFFHKMDEHHGNALRYATYFSEVISEGVLCENHDHVPVLSELITLGFVLKFKNEEIEFLMESKNLQIFFEDEEFLSSAFPSN